MSTHESLATGRRSSIAYANLFDPGFALAAMFILIAVPYFYPITYMDEVKYFTIAQHIVFISIFGTALITIYAFYRLFFNIPASPEVECRYDEKFLSLMFRISRGMVYFSILANAVTLLIGLRYYNGALGSSRDAVKEGGGIFILGELHLFFMISFIYIGYKRGAKLRTPLLILGCLLFARSFLMSERLAFLEFAVPLLVILSMLKIFRISWARLGGLAILLPTLFVVNEMFRSFYAKFVTDKGWAYLDWTFVVGWNLERFFIYYIDTLNKFYFALSVGYFNDTAFWADGIGRILDRLQGVNVYVDNVIDAPLSVMMTDWGVYNAEMTNPGGLAEIATDFGYWGIPYFIFLISLFLLLHRQATRGNLLCVALYPSFVVTIGEIPRYVYLYETRCIFPLFTFLFIYVACRLMSLSDKSYHARLTS